MDCKYNLCIFTKNNDIKDRYIEAINKHNIQIKDPYYNSGFDLIVPVKINTANETKIAHDTEVVAAMFKDNEPISYYLYPRSSLSKTNLRLANSVGIIDSGYRGNLIGMFDVISNNNLIIPEYSRILQICSPTLEKFSVRIVNTIEELGITPRGTGGFGSTG
jgi:dUTPase